LLLLLMAVRSLAIDTHWPCLFLSRPSLASWAFVEIAQAPMEQRNGTLA
jgi:hypothetical protein